MLSIIVLSIISSKYDLKDFFDSKISEFFIPAITGIYFATIVSLSGLISLIQTNIDTKFVRLSRKELFSTYVGTIVPFLWSLIFLGAAYHEEIVIKSAIYLIFLIIILMASVYWLFISLFLGLATPKYLRNEFGFSILGNLILFFTGASLNYYIYINL